MVSDFFFFFCSEQSLLRKEQNEKPSEAPILYPTFLFIGKVWLFTTMCLAAQVAAKLHSAHVQIYFSNLPQVFDAHSTIHGPDSYASITGNFQIHGTPCFPDHSNPGVQFNKIHVLFNMIQKNQAFLEQTWPLSLSSYF